MKKQWKHISRWMVALCMLALFSSPLHTEEQPTENNETVITNLRG